MIHARNEGQRAMREDEWAVILAGGDGTRLKSLTLRIAGDERPKQFCRILGSRTLLEQTRRRVALQISPERTLFVLNRLHQTFYQPLLADTARRRLVVQPHNRGTTPAILYSLLRIAAVESDALVAFFPSDHYISDDDRFMGHIRDAFDAVRARPELVALLGIHPQSPEVEYGWIEPSGLISTLGMGPMMGVLRFWEKPNSALAKVLQARGCLWNSFVMVASVRGLLAIMEGAVTEVYNAFAELRAALCTRREAGVAVRVYQSLKEANFSQQVLASRPERLAVIRVAGITWNDLGEPRRVMASLDFAGLRPQWTEMGIRVVR